MTQPKQNLRHPLNARVADAQGFKPVALPALAAAVRQVKAGVASERRPSPHDLPAILRKTAQLG